MTWSAATDMNRVNDRIRNNHFTVHVGYKEFSDSLCSERLLAIPAGLSMKLTGSAFCTIHHYDENKSRYVHVCPHIAYSTMFRLQ